MAKEKWRPGNMLYPLPVVLVTSRNKAGDDNVCTVAWAGTVCSSPAMLSISLMPSRLSCDYIREAGVFAVNLTTEQLAYATDYCGVVSGRKEDKFKTACLTKAECDDIACSYIDESPVAIECRVTREISLGSHIMFIAEVICVHADEAYLDDRGRFDLDSAHPIVYSHGTYYGTGKKLGSFGYSVKGGMKKK